MYQDPMQMTKGEFRFTMVVMFIIGLMIAGGI